MFRTENPTLENKLQFRVSKKLSARTSSKNVHAEKTIKAIGILLAALVLALNDDYYGSFILYRFHEIKFYKQKANPNTKFRKRMKIIESPK